MRVGKLYEIKKANLIRYFFVVVFSACNDFYWFWFRLCAFMCMFFSPSDHFCCCWWTIRNELYVVVFSFSVPFALTHIAHNIHIQRRQIQYERNGIKSYKKIKSVLLLFIYLYVVGVGFFSLCTPSWYFALSHSDDSLVKFYVQIENLVSIYPIGANVNARAKSLEKKKEIIPFSMCLRMHARTHTHTRAQNSNLSQWVVRYS